VEQILNTLFLTHDEAYLRLDHETFKIEIPGQPPRLLPMLNIGGVVVMGHGMISPKCMQWCLEQGRTITFLDSNGRFLARVEGEVSGNVLLRKAQYTMLGQPERTLEAAKSFVAGKIQNCRSLLMKKARGKTMVNGDNAEDDGCDQLGNAIENLSKILGRVGKAKTLDILRGLEGEAAAIYFRFLPLLIKDRKKWKFDQRNRRPPRDPVNAMLSFLYTILTHDVRSALEGVGLDSQAGYLHALRPGRPALALDLMEEFRSIFVDRLVIARINRNQVKVNDFKTRPGGAVEMSEEARKELIVDYQNRKKEEVNHPLTGKKVPLGLIPHLQARILARFIRGEGHGYIPYTIR
jgi:CRISPR-associated protein Cas1